MRHLAILALAVTSTACMVGADDEIADQAAGGKADATGSCTDKRYGDGTCHLALACAIPDIDCFHTFETDAEARASFAADGPPAVLGASDARVTRARSLVDRAWKAYTSFYTMGQLTAKHLSVVVIADDNANAFVIADPGTQKAQFAVYVHSGLLTATYTDDMILGVLAHELGHMGKLHMYPDVSESLQRYYLASTTEPIGAVQIDHSALHPPANTWNVIAQQGGDESRIELGGMPFAGDYGALFNQLMSELLQSTNARCKTNARAAQDLREGIASEFELDDSIVIYSTTQADVEDALALLEACRPNTGTLRALASRMEDVALKFRLEQQLPATERALLETNALDALTTLVATRRASLRALAAEFARKQGSPMTSLRYYSHEEQADDIAVRVTRAGGFTTVGGSDFGKQLLGSQAAACEQARLAGSVPYGITLADPHHGMCWRIAHAYQYAASLENRAHLHETDDLPIGEAFEPTQPPTGERMY